MKILRKEVKKSGTKKFYLLPENPIKVWKQILDKLPGNAQQLVIASPKTSVAINFFWQTVVWMLFCTKIKLSIAICHDKLFLLSQAKIHLTQFISSKNQHLLQLQEIDRRIQTDIHPSYGRLSRPTAGKAAQVLGWVRRGFGAHHFNTTTSHIG